MRKEDLKIILTVMPIIYLLLIIMDYIPNKNNIIEERKASFIEFQNQNEDINLNFKSEKDNYIFAVSNEILLDILNKDLKKEKFYLTIKNKRCITSIRTKNYKKDFNCIRFSSL